MPWHHNDLTELAGAQGSPALQFAIGGYSTPWNEQQHVNYFDAQGHIHELYYANGAWKHNDLFVRATDIEGASPRNPASPNAISGFASSWNEQQHIAYIDTAGHVNQLVYGGNWGHQDFIDLFNPGAARASLRWPAAQGILTAYPTAWNDQQHIIYIGELSHTHELVYDGHWHSSDLVPRIEGAQFGIVGGIYGYTTPWNHSQHIIVIEESGKITELYYSDHWGMTALAGPSGGPQIHNNALHGHITDWNRQEHVVYIDTNDHINELYYVDGSHDWRHNDLTALATASNGGIPVGIAGSISQGRARAITSHSTPWNQQQHVNYVDPQGFINELWYDGQQWRHNNLTVLAPGAENAKYVSGGVAIASYVTSWNHQQHVVYIDVSGHINELYYQ